MKIWEYKTVATVVREDAIEIVGNTPASVNEYMKDAFNQWPEQEQVWVVFLNRKNKIKGRQMITLGSMTACIAHPREVFRAVLLGSCTAFVLVHNHPSGDPAPSNDDLRITRELREGARIINIEFLDHVIIGEVFPDPLKKGYFSFREAGML